MWQNSGYFEVIWLQFPPVTWHWFRETSIRGSGLAIRAASLLHPAICVLMLRYCLPCGLEWVKPRGVGHSQNGSEGWMVSGQETMVVSSVDFLNYLFTNNSQAGCPSVMYKPSTCLVITYFPI
jgi:hypothetical protein